MPRGREEEHTVPRAVSGHRKGAWGLEGCVGSYMVCGELEGLVGSGYCWGGCEPEEHTGESEGDRLWKLLAPHRHFEAVAKVDVQDLAREAVQHQVGGVAVAQPEDVPDHRHDGE